VEEWEIQRGLRREKGKSSAKNLLHKVLRQSGINKGRRGNKALGKQWEGQGQEKTFRFEVILFVKPKVKEYYLRTCQGGRSNRKEKTDDRDCLLLTQRS